MGQEKFIGYFKLIEACGQPGCPVCCCVVGESRSYLDAFLYEQVTNPDTRRALRASWGFCNWHTWMLLEIENSLFGAAILDEDLATLALRRTEGLGERPRRPGGWAWLAALTGRPRRSSILELYRKRAVCPACASAADTEGRCLQTLVRFVDDGDLQAAYARSNGLCLPHLFAAVEQNALSSGAKALVERTREKWGRVGQDVTSFMSKHDYRNREPYTAAEAASYRRAFGMLVGANGVFGNVHARTAGTSRKGGGSACANSVMRS